MTRKTVYTEVEVDVDISDFDTDDLVDELKSRGIVVADDNDADEDGLLSVIYRKRRMGQDYQRELDELIYNVLGKVI